MYFTLLRLYVDGKLGTGDVATQKLDNAISKGWITKEEKVTVLSNPQV